MVWVFATKRVVIFNRTNTKLKDMFRAFLDFFVLFSGISTASNLTRTQGRKLLTRGIFLFRSGREDVKNR